MVFNISGASLTIYGLTIQNLAFCISKTAFYSKKHFMRSRIEKVEEKVLKT